MMGSDADPEPHGIRAAVRCEFLAAVYERRFGPLQAVQAALRHMVRNGPMHMPRSDTSCAGGPEGCGYYALSTS
jgi:hypothetical protein